MARPEAEDLLAIARVTRAHGVRGEVSAIALAPPVLDAAGLIIGRRLYARGTAGDVRPIQGLSVRFHQDRWLIHLAGIESMDEADVLRGVELCLPRAELPELPEGWFWEADLQECEVIDRRLGPIGAADGLNTSGARPQLELRRPDDSIALIPWVRALIIEVDLDNKKIFTDLPLDFPGIS